MPGERPFRRGRAQRRRARHALSGRGWLLLLALACLLAAAVAVFAARELGATRGFLEAHRLTSGAARVRPAPTV